MSSRSTEIRTTRTQRTLAGLRRAVASSTEFEGPGRLRERFRSVAETVPHRLDELWAAGGQFNSGAVDVIDLFSGCGGMSAGFRAVNGLLAAFKTILAVDIDDAANQTYEQNLGVKPNKVDIHELAGNPDRMAALMKAGGRRPTAPLVMIGCAPCQGFSSHRNAAGSADNRNGLFVDFARIAVDVLPDFVVIENVPELYTDRYWSHVEDARDMFLDAGYFVHLAVHNFAHFGLPQERFRAVMLASRKPFSPPAGFVQRPEFVTVRDAIGSLPIVQAGEVLETDPMHQSASHRSSTIELIRRVPKDGGKRPFDEGPASLRALGTKQGKPAYEDVYGRLFWDRPAITITHYSRNPASGRFVHPEQDRGLTVREAALLQGFPVEFHFSGGFDDRFKQIGNAVPPVVAAHLALTILGQLLDPPSDGPDIGVTKSLGQSFSRLIPSLKANDTYVKPRALL